MKRKNRSSKLPHDESPPAEIAQANMTAAQVAPAADTPDDSNAPSADSPEAGAGKSRRRGHKPLVFSPKRGAVLGIPRNRAGIARFVKEHFGLAVPDRSFCPGHDSPLDYLYSSFIEQEDLLVWANRGGGKTYLAAVATLMDALLRGPMKISVLGGSFDQSDRLADYIRLMLHEHSELVVGRITRQRVKLTTGSAIEMLAQSQTAVRGQHVQKVRCDEVDLFDAEVWRAVQFATRSKDSARGSIEVLSTLHRSGGLMQRLVDASSGQAQGGYKLVRWCLWEVIERCPPTRECATCPLAEDCRGMARNARGFFRIEDAIAIRARSSRNAWEAEMLCRGARRDWLVFGEFDRARHVATRLYQPQFPLYRAIDFGYRSPMVCLWIQLTPSGSVHVLDEYVMPRKAIDQHAIAIRKRDMGHVTATYVDPAGRQKESTSGLACTDMLGAAGIPCTCRCSGITDGLELVRSALDPADGKAALVIDPRCRGLIEAFESYHYPSPDSNQPDSDKPVKDGPDHLIDALRYFFVNRMMPGYEMKRMYY